MKASYGLPSGTYNLVLTLEEAKQLFGTGLVTMHTGHTPCRTSRDVWDKEKNDLVPLDKKEVFNDLMFHLDENVADIEAGDHHVQYLNVIIGDELYAPKEESNLKHCPFCWSDVELIETAHSYMVSCVDPYCAGHFTKWFANKEDAIEAWNRRAINEDAFERWFYGLEDSTQV